MSFEDIKIVRQIPIINGYLQVPPNKETDKTRVTIAQALLDLPGQAVNRLSMGSGKPRGSKQGQQQWFELAAITPNTWYTTDPVASLV